MAEKRKLPPGVPEAFRELMEDPISFFPALGRLCGSAAAGLMLCQAFFWTGNKEVIARGGWFWKTAADWEEETCLSSREQRTAREALLKLGFWEEEKHKINGAPTMHFRVKIDAIIEAHIDKCRAKMESAEKTNHPQNGKCGNDKSIESAETTNEPPDLSKKEIHETTNPIYTENTSKEHAENTTENGFHPSREGLHTRMEALKISHAEQKPLYLYERALLPVDEGTGLNATEVALAVCNELGRRGDADWIAMEKAVVAYRVANPAKSWEQCAEELMAAWAEYEKLAKGTEFKYGFKGFLDSSHYLKRDEWPKPPAEQNQQGAMPSGHEFIEERRRRLGDKIREGESK
jgi:hypothetical protein